MPCGSIPSERLRHQLNWGTLHRRFLAGWEIRDGGTELFRPRTVAIIRRPDPEPLGERADRVTPTGGMSPRRAGCDESRTSGSEGGSRRRTG